MDEIQKRFEWNSDNFIKVHVDQPAYLREILILKKLSGFKHIVQLASEQCSIKNSITLESYDTNLMIILLEQNESPIQSTVIQKMVQNIIQGVVYCPYLLILILFILDPFL